jgi:hypothetical protein
MLVVICHSMRMQGENDRHLNSYSVSLFFVPRSIKQLVDLTNTHIVIGTKTPSCIDQSSQWISLNNVESKNVKKTVLLSESIQATDRNKIIQKMNITLTPSPLTFFFGKIL